MLETEGPRPGHKLTDGFIKFGHSMFLQTSFASAMQLGNQGIGLRDRSRWLDLLRADLYPWVCICFS